MVYIFSFIQIKLCPCATLLSFVWLSFRSVWLALPSPVSTFSTCFYFFPLVSTFSYLFSLVSTCLRFYLIVCTCIYLFLLLSTCFHLFLLVCTCIYLFLLVCTSFHLFSLVSTCLHLYLLVSTSFHLFSLVSTCFHLYLLVSTCLHLYLLVSTYLYFFPLVFTCIYLFALVSTCFYMFALVSTCFHLHLLVSTCLYLSLADFLRFSDLTLRYVLHRSQRNAALRIKPYCCNQTTTSKAFCSVKLRRVRSEFYAAVLLQQINLHDTEVSFIGIIIHRILLSSFVFIYIR